MKFKTETKPKQTRVLMGLRVVIIKNIIGLLLVVALALSDVALGLLLSSEKTVLSVKGAVTANGKGCAEIGGQMLEDGGSAVDAAIATLLCEGVLLPQSTGIGGGFVATIYKKSTGRVETIIARESAPAAANATMFLSESRRLGAIVAAVPGELLGYHEMHKKYGILEWKLLFQPTIKLCKEGHHVSKFLAKAMKKKESFIRTNPSLGEIFIKEDGTLYQEGDTLKRTQLGKTLEIIAEKGVEEFYGGGELGKIFVDDVQRMGGFITEQDLKDFRVSWEDKYHVTANVTGGYTLYTTPLPTSGALLAFMLNVLTDLYTDDHNVYWQRVIETFKHAYGHRSNLDDLEKEPEMANTIRETFKNLINKDFSKHISTLIYDNKTFEDIAYYGAKFTIAEDHGTANVVVLAPNGDAIAITSTINTYFGAKVRSRRTGIILNDEMDDFSTPGVVNSFGVPASPANYIKPGKRPMSSMCPAIVLDKEGNVQMLVGAAGGTRITTAVVSTILKYLILNETIDQAIDGGRLHHQLLPMYVEVEAQVPESVRNYLRTVGHKLDVLPSGFTAVTAIGVRSGDPKPYYDRRRGGSTAIVHVKNKIIPKCFN